MLLLEPTDDVDEASSSIEGCELTHIGRESNEEADVLANIGSTCSPVPPGVFFETIQHRSVKVKYDDSKTTEHSRATPQNPAIEQVLLIEPTWTGPYIAYLERNDSGQMISRQMSSLFWLHELE